MTTPQAVFGGAALIAAVIYLGLGGQPAEAQFASQQYTRYTVVSQGNGKNLWMLDGANGTVRLCAAPAAPDKPPRCGPPGK